MTGTSKLKGLNESREDIAPGTKVAFVDCEGRLKYGVAVETGQQYGYGSFRRVTIVLEGGSQVSPAIERVAVL